MTTRLLFSLFAFFCFTHHTVAQVEFAPIGAEWVYTGFVSNDSIQNQHINLLDSIDIFRSMGDTIIDGLKLRKVNDYFFHQNNDSVSLWNEGDLYLIYNFGLEEGQTETFYLPFNYFPHPYPWAVEVNPVTLTVDSIRTILVSGQSLKRFYLGGYYSYIERVGMLGVGWGLVGPAMPLALEYQPPWLRCYKDSIVEYKWDRFVNEFNVDDCYYTPSSATNEVEGDLDVEISPNPVTDLLTVDLGEFHLRDWSITDWAGRTFYAAATEQSGQLQIPTAHWPSGLYLVRANWNGHWVLWRVVKV